MMSLTKKDWIVAAIIFVLAAIIGGCVHSIFSPVKTIITPIDDGRYIKMSDSLLLQNNRNKDTIKVLYKHIHLSDSLSLNNLKQITHDKKIIKNFTPISRKHYLDSLFKSAGI